MKTFIFPKLVSHLATAALLIVLTGCATANYKKGAGTSTALTQTADQIASYNSKIDTALAALKDMANDPEGDLVAKYNKFHSAAGELVSTVKNVTSRVGSLGAMGNDYFKAWEKQLPLIQDPDIRLRSAQRKAEVEKEFADIKLRFADVQASFQPFLSYLKDIQLALGTDLTVDGIASIKSAVKQADAKAQPLKDSVSRLVDQFRDLGLAMASSTPVPEAAATEEKAEAPATSKTAE